MVGGALVGIGCWTSAPSRYVNRSVEALSIADFVMGLVKASVFGALIAFAGCFRGMRSGRSAAAVGEATTSAVVTCIVPSSSPTVSYRCLQCARVLRSPSAKRSRRRGTHSVVDLTMAYGSFVIQRDLTFEVAPGDIFVIMGGSGCGKSTLLAT